MLTLIGVLFTADHLTEYDIGRTWPLILIVYGVLLLAARFTQPPRPPLVPPAPVPPIYRSDAGGGPQ
jgi:hypothetical protein